jgi:hypothetical protein
MSKAAKEANNIMTIGGNLMAKESTKSRLDRHYDLYDEAIGFGRTFEEHIKVLEAEVNYDRQRERQFFAARAKMRDGYGNDIDPENVDFETIRQDLGLPRGHEATLLIKSEVKKLLAVQKQD